MVPSIIGNLVSSTQRLYSNYGQFYDTAQKDAQVVIGTALKVVIAVGLIFTAQRFSVIASGLIGALSIPSSLIALGLIATTRCLTKLFHSVSWDHFQTVSAFGVTAWTMFHFAGQKINFLNYAEKPIEDLTATLASWVIRFYPQPQQ